MTPLLLALLAAGPFPDAVEALSGFDRDVDTLDHVLKSSTGAVNVGAECSGTYDPGTTCIGDDLFAEADASIAGALTCGGNATFGGDVILGDDQRVCLEADCTSYIYSSADGNVGVVTNGTSAWNCSPSQCNFSKTFAVTIDSSRGLLFAPGSVPAGVASRLILSGVADGTDQTLWYRNHTQTARPLLHGAGALNLQAQIAASPEAPFACDATYVGYTQHVDDSDDGAAAEVCICTAITDSTYDWRQLDDLGAACSFY